MMVDIFWSQTAQDDIDDIAAYIALDNPYAAEKLVKRIFSLVEQLKNFPELGRSLPELPHLAYREMITNPCRIIYKYSHKKCTIIRVIRQERDLKRLPPFDI